MKSTCTTCFTLLLFLASSLPCLSQIISTDPTITATTTTMSNNPVSCPPCDAPTTELLNNTTLLGDLPVPGSYVPGELIVYFASAPDQVGRDKFENDVLVVGGLVEEWSPTHRFARVTDLDFTTCGIISGTGNPLNDIEDGGGQQYDFNYYAGTQSWVSNANDCNFFDEINDGSDPYLAYSPTLNCSDEAKLLPPTGQSTVRVAIIDSGVKYASEDEIVNNVRHWQTIVPGTCTGDECDPVVNNITSYSNNFNLHGGYIYKLISGWFRAKGLEGLLSVHSYQILDNQLRCTVFQGIKAIEYATYEEKTDIINLSIGFQPAACLKEPRGKAVHNNRSMLYYAIKNAGHEGVIVVSSAGNSGVDLKVSPQYPAADRGLDNLIVVGALNCESDARACWSNYSDLHVDLFAQGAKVKVIDGGCYFNLYGTSFAAPIVAAKAAFHHTLPTITPQKVLCSLRDQADEFCEAKYGFVNSFTSNGVCTAAEIDGTIIGDQTANPAIDIFNIAPNPFSNQLQLIPTLTENQFYGTASLIDARGNIVFQRELKGTKLILELGDITPGMYFLHVTTQNGKEVKRVMKQ